MDDSVVFGSTRPGAAIPTCSTAHKGRCFHTISHDHAGRCRIVLESQAATPACGITRPRAAARPTKADASIRSRMIMPVGVESSWKVWLRLRPAVYRAPDLQHGPQNPARLYSPLKKLKKSQPGGRRLEKRWDTSSKHTSWSALEKSSGAFLF